MPEPYVSEVFEDCAPIFIVGAPRSGTTLLERMLDAHPAIAIADEIIFFDIILQARERVPELDSPERIRHFFDLLPAMDHVRYWNHADEILSQVKAGEVRILAVSSEKRIGLWPDVPTMKESGVDVVFDQWRGLAAPKGTPKAVIDKMTTLVKKAVESKDWIEFTASVGTTPQYRDPENFFKFVGEMDKLTKEVVATAGIK